MGLNMTLICTSPKTNVYHHHMCLFANCLSSLIRYLFKFLFNFKIGLLGSLYVLSQMYNLQIFSPSLWLVFSFSYQN
jgi:hypothetical protein